MTEGEVPFTQSAYSIPNFARYIYAIGTVQCCGRANERPLGNWPPVRSFLFVPPRRRYIRLAVRYGMKGLYQQMITSLGNGYLDAEVSESL